MDEEATRLKFPDAPKFADTTEPTLADFKPYTVGWLIQRFIDATRQQQTMKPLGESHLYLLRSLQNRAIAKKIAAKLRKQDIIEYCQMRRETVSPATVLHDISGLTGVLKYAGSAWDDCEDVSEAQIAAAKPFLAKHQIIGKSTPRKRRPTDEEIERLLALFEHQNKNARTQVNMAQVVAFGLVSTRRIGEICRIRHGDIDWERKDDDGNATPMYMVRDLKHPTKKKGNDKWFPLFPELAEIIRRQPRLSPEDPNERVFPYYEKTCSARYTRAKHKLGIVDLHLHDNRREAITRWLKKLPPHKVKLISGHETTHILERVYDAQNPAELHQELAAIDKAAQVSAAVR